MIALDIVSDPVCPWCYIGKARLDRALEARPEHPFAMNWHPYMLNPDMPAEGMDRREYLEARFGREQALAVHGQILEMAEAAGIEMDFAAITRMPSTLDAHRLIRWARIDGNQSSVVNQLFRRYFREGQDISDREVLADIGAGAGMERELVTRMLAGTADIAEVRAEDAHAREIGISGVPTFLIAGQFVLQGAQEAETWAQVIEELDGIDPASLVPDAGPRQ